MNFLYSRKDLIVGSVAMGIVITLMAVGFGVASGKQPYKSVGGT